MENITRALLIAGGILITLIIISMFLVMYNNVSNIAKTQEEKTKQEQLENFNAKFEAYNKDLMYGVDVITLSNKVNQNNFDNPQEKIEIYLTLTLDNLVLNNEKVEEIKLLTRQNNVVQYAEIKIESNPNPIKVDNFDKNVFKCVNMIYNDRTGKVEKILIENR